MPDNQLSVRFWGVRGSRPSTGSPFLSVGGNTSCIEVLAGGRRIILDAGTGCINLGHQLLQEQSNYPLLFLLSHYHHDHIQGLPHFPPVYRTRRPLIVVSPTTLHPERVWNYLAQSTGRILPESRLDTRRYKVETVEGDELMRWAPEEPRALKLLTQEPAGAKGQVLIQSMRSLAHPRGGSVCYRITWGGASVVYATDVESYVGCDQALVSFARGADLLIHDAQYTEQEYTHSLFPRQGWGHSTWAMAVETALAAEVKALALFHHDPEHSDELLDGVESQARARFAGTFLAREGQTFTCGQPIPEPTTVAVSATS